MENNLYRNGFDMFILYFRNKRLKAFGPFFLSILFLFGVSKVSIVTAQSNDQTIVWPTDAELVISTFGPRLLEGRYDFHRGIDIYGDSSNRILAMAAGKVVSVDESSGSIFIEHPQLNSPSGGMIYSRYTHMASLDVKATDIVDAGDDLGGMGNVGGNLVHLHFEIREDIPFSLTYQLDNGGCRTDPCKDPHVNALRYLREDDKRAPLVEVISGEGETLRIRVEVGADEMDINRFEVRSSGRAPIILDYDTREGFDVTTAANIDQNPTASGAFFEVLPYGKSAANREDNFAVEVAFPGVLSYSSIRVSDIFGNVTELTNGDDDFLLRLIPSIIKNKK